MKKNRKYKKIKIIMVFTTVLLMAFVAVVGLYKTGIYRFDFFKDVYKKIDFQLSTNELNIPQDALSFSVYDIEQGEYLFYEGDSQLPTVASLAKLFVIDYALTKVKTTFIVNVKQSESANKPLNTVFQEICRHEMLGDFSADKYLNLENLQKSS